MLWRVVKLFFLTDNGWFQIYKHRSGDVFAGAGLTEERVEGVVSSSYGLITGHLAIRLDSVLQTIQLPAPITYLDTCLADVHADTLTLHGGIEKCFCWKRSIVQHGF